MAIIYAAGFNPNSVHIGEALSLNAIRIDFPQSVVPGYSQKVEFAAKTEAPIDLVVVMHEDKRDQWKSIPLIDN